MRLRYSLIARAELQEITDYIAQRNPRGAARVLRQAKATIELLQEFPRRGRKQRQNGVRKLGAGKFPYNIYYHVDEHAHEITILNIRHARRRRKYRDA
jgi:plasmid stabilization system protein ParE